MSCDDVVSVYVNMFSSVSIFHICCIIFMFMFLGHGFPGRSVWCGWVTSSLPVEGLGTWQVGIRDTWLLHWASMGQGKQLIEGRITSVVSRKKKHRKRKFGKVLKCGIVSMSVEFAWMELLWWLLSLKFTDTMDLSVDSFRSDSCNLEIEPQRRSSS